MSFATDIKEELVKILPHEKHCKVAELSALVKCIGRLNYEECSLTIESENAYAVRKCFTLLNKTYNINTGVFEKECQDGPVSVTFTDREGITTDFLYALSVDNPLKLLDKDCCKRAYLRGSFLAAGYIGDPGKGYQFEIVSDDVQFARLTDIILKNYDVNAKQVMRKKYFVTYLKDFESISDVLNILGAHKAMMGYAEARIVRDVRNDINRRNNCDMANITKAVNAAGRQIEDIEYIANTVGLGNLPHSLMEIANVRLEHPESSLTELGQILDPPVGKSGVNHRLRKLCDYAESLRKEREKRE